MIFLFAVARRRRAASRCGEHGRCSSSISLQLRLQACAGKGIDVAHAHAAMMKPRCFVIAAICGLLVALLKLFMFIVAGDSIRSCTSPRPTFFRLLRWTTKVQDVVLQRSKAVLA